MFESNHLFLAALLALAAIDLSGQTAPPQFEAASIKPSGPFVPGNMRIRMTGGPGTGDPGRVIFEKYVLSDLIEIAYDIKHYQLSGPDWLINSGVDSPRFDITAKLPEGTTKEQYRLMLRNLLAERFKLTIHNGTKEMPIYNLVVAKNGPKFASPDNAVNDGFPKPPPDTGGVTFNTTGGARLQGVNLSMQKLANLLSVARLIDRPVHDATGLTGDYNFILRWQRDGMEAAGAAALPTIFSAVQEQLGLKLESGKDAVDVLVVDHIEKSPTEN
jgi:uncharacterized protein (TIGR03435 family)